MYPNLYYAVKDLFGLQLPFLKMFQSFGVFVAMAFFAASYFLTQEIKRKEKENLIKPSLLPIEPTKPTGPYDYLIAIIIGFIIGYKLLFVILNFTQFTENTQGFILSVEGNFIGGLIGGVVSGIIKYFESKEASETADGPKDQHLLIYPHEHVGNMTLIAAVAGIIGAKIFHNLENWNDFMNDPMGALLSFSGLTMYGGLIFGSAGVLWYAKKQHIPLLPLMDACAPGLMLAYGIGRIGCQVAGDGDWGIDNLSPKPSWLSIFPDWVWSYSYPHNVNEIGIAIPGAVGKYSTILEHPVFPTPMYESLICIGLFFVLWRLRRVITLQGTLFSLYLFLNGIERFFIEKIRINTQYHMFGIGITQAEIISTLLIFIGGIGIIWFSNRKAYYSIKSIFNPNDKS